MPCVTLDHIYCLLKCTIPVQMIENLLISQSLHRYRSPGYPHILKFLYFLYEAGIHHLIHAAVDTLIHCRPFIGDHKKQCFISFFLFPLLCIMCRNRLSGFMIVFQRPDHTLYVILMDTLAGRRIHRFQHLKERSSPLLFRQFFQWMPVCIIGILGCKINIIQNRLDIKTGSAADDGNMSAFIDTLHCIFCHFLENGHIELFDRIQHIDQMMRYPFRFFRSDLCRADVHPAIYHRISRDHLPADLFGYFYGCGRFSGRRRPCYNDEWLFFAGFVHIMLQIIF